MSDEDPLVNGVPLSTLRVVDLKEELTRRGLAKHGNKSELAERLREHLLTGKILDSKSQSAGTVAAVTPTKEATPQPKISSPENPLIAAYKAKQQAALENQMKDASRIRAESGSASGDTPPISSPANSGSPIKSPAPEVKSPMKSAEPEPEKEKEKAKETEKKQPVAVAEVEQKKEKEQPPAKQEDREKTAKQQDKNGHGKDEKIEAGRQETESKLKKEDTKAQEVKKEEKSEASQKNEQGNQSNDKQKQKEEKIEEKPKVEQKKQPVAEKSSKKEKTPPPKREKTPEEKQTRKEQNELEREQKREKQREEIVSSRTATDSSGKDSDKEDAEEELDYGDEQDEKEDKKNEERPGSASNSSATAHRSRSAAAADSTQSKSAEPIEINGRKISPSRYPESEIVHIRGLVRPFTEGQLRSAISANDKRTIVDFWIDKVKSHCLAKMSSAEEAREVRLALHNSHWPESNPKTLTVQFDTQDNMERHKEGRPVAGQIEVGLRTSASATSPTPSAPFSAHRSSSTSEARIGALPGRSSLKVTVEAALRENSKREVELVERRSKNSHKMEVDGDQEDDKSSRKRQHSPTPPHSRSMEIKRFNSDRLEYSQGHGPTENSLPKQKEGKSLDELFQRTKCQPFVYFKPLTDEEAAERDRQREARRKEREERRRETSGDRDKNRDRDRERHRDRERDNRDRAPAASTSRR
ncbi:hypothetical protein WR25_01830 [Diploscapter pachys]|uniref:SAP domain-containing protein n=1 Tax=Diploscapter pachys TaxID=2018661 RepID=A0A2A2JD35_9BILA|nr:hypothetical protein WR25_01830 [Diploscapter pachys]